MMFRPFTPNMLHQLGSKIEVSNTDPYSTKAYVISLE